MDKDIIVMTEEQSRILYRMEEKIDGLGSAMKNLENHNQRLEERMDALEGLKNWATGAFAALVFAGGVLTWAFNQQLNIAEANRVGISQRVYNLCRAVRVTSAEVCDVE